MRRTILIVDDQLINRRILGKLLEKEYEIINACDGKEALEILKENAESISAVLLDIIMPVMDGYQVLEVMGKDPVLMKIPVIVSSQKDGDEDEIRALSLGAQDFIAKPYKGDIIRHRLGNTIRLRETAAMINRAERDELTGLYNKQFFIEMVGEEFRQNPEKDYDILCFGIERFRLINETFGSAKGDELLKYIAEVLREGGRDINLCGRFSADMFYMMLPHQENYNKEDFRPWMEKVNCFPIDMDIKLHCGIYIVKDKTLPVSVICDRAQLAAEKNKGMYDTPFSFYDESIHQKLQEEQFITSTMQTALEQKQFQVYYQPKYDLNNELVAGAEALVRWIHPEKGFLSPGSFIPLFEKSGFITQLDCYVWETACRDIRKWLDLGYNPVAVSVNVSRADIYNSKLTDILLSLIAKYEIPIRYLHLEITESAYTDNPDQIILVVNKLRSLGFVIEMDDFGSGYSSLNMLAEMPVDILKLDMRFIQTETKKASGRGILSFVISLAKWLDLAVVAEGVETGDQISILRSMDCNYVQGFYFAKPMKESEFEMLLKTTQTVEMICDSRTAKQLVEEPMAESNPGNERIMLVVDDIEVNRAVLAGTFEDEYKIVEKENGSTAWDYINNHFDEIDIVLLDLLMPVMDGFHLLDKIRSDSRTKNLPVIITSQGDIESEHRALEMQADDFISKPYNPDIIRHRVYNVIAGHRFQEISAHEAEVNRELSSEEQAKLLVKQMRPHFDIARLVDPDHTLICDDENVADCGMHSCYSVWGKATRCNNCISLSALREKKRYCKLEYSDNGLYFVISEYVPYGESGAVVEMVTKLDDEYVDNIFDKNMLYVNLDAIHRQLDLDEMTGVYNRRHIDNHLEEYIAKAKSCEKNIGLAMVDIDAFKTLNDTYGHLVGDQIIKSVAKTLKNNIAISKGDFVARFGGDEFLLVCRDIAPEVFARRIRSVADIIKHIKIDDHPEISVGISGGCACVDEFPTATATELLDIADKRLYKAKENGRGNIVSE